MSKTPAEQLDTLLENVVKVAGPAAPYVQIAREITGVVLKLVEAGHPIAEIRRRLADGIQSEDIVSNEALDDAKRATKLVDDFLGGLKE